MMVMMNTFLSMWVGKVSVLPGHPFTGSAAREKSFLGSFSL